jgi:hypothetical protein
VRRPGAAGAQNAEGPGLESIGTIVDEGARFIRGNRAVTDFVGADSAETARFVGMLQSGTGEQLQSAVDDNLGIDAGTDVNRVIEPVIPPRLRLNAPRLELGFVARQPPTELVQVTAVQRLQNRLPDLDPSLFEVSVADGVATLRGLVASERDRTMAALLLGFEPGIVRVQNELTVVSPDRMPANPGAAPASAATTFLVDGPRNSELASRGPFGSRGFRRQFPGGWQSQG